MITKEEFIRDMDVAWMDEEDVVSRLHVIEHAIEDILEHN